MALIHSALRARTRPFVRILMLVLGVLAMPSAGQALLNGSHCARHDAPAHGPGMRMADGHAPALWQSASSHACPHCPANECARFVPCAGGASSIVAATAPVSAAPPTTRIRLRPFDDSARSVPRQPPTPPPLPVS